MKNHESCSFWIYTNKDEMKIEKFDTLDELIEICQDNELNYQDQAIQLGEGSCSNLSDDDFISFFEFQLDNIIADYHIEQYEMGKLFEYQ